MIIARPRWKEPEFTPAEINKAGNIIRDEVIDNQVKSDALKVIDKDQCKNKITNESR